MILAKPCNISGTSPEYISTDIAFVAPSVYAGSMNTTTTTARRRSAARQTIRERFAANLRAIRRERDVTQQSLATALGTRHATVSDWERGAKAPPLDMIGRIADALGADFAAFFGDPSRISEKSSAS